MRLIVEGDCDIEISSIVIQGTLEEVLAWRITRLGWAIERTADAFRELEKKITEAMRK